MSEELKPCPFCGSTNIGFVYRGIDHEWVSAICGECGAEGPDGDERESVAIELWNARK